MSRIGKKTIEVPSGVTVVIQGNQITVQGPKGELKLMVHTKIKVTKEEAGIVVVPFNAQKPSKQEKALWGLTRALVANMVHGVQEGYTKKLEIEGVGYRVAIEGTTLVMTMGFSHPVVLEIPQGILCEVDKGSVTVSGIDRQLVGQFAANIRRVRPVEPYKGKGIRYEGEQVRRKLGKRAATAGAGAK
jgi:large subunit ribosomal protein L6